MKQIFARIRMRLERNKFLQNIIPPLIGGLIIGAVNIALPLTAGDGQMAIAPIIKYGYLNVNNEFDIPPEIKPFLTDDVIDLSQFTGNSRVDPHLLVSTGFATMFLLAVSMNCGFVGGFVLPTIMVGIIAGTICYQLFPFLPLGLCVSCFLAAVPGGICPMPYTLACLAIFMLSCGLYQTVPVFISTITAYSVVCGSGIFTALQRRALKKAETSTQMDKDAALARSMQDEKNFAIDQFRGGQASRNSNRGTIGSGGADNRSSTQTETGRTQGDN